jgi:hypothetical protein
MLQGRILDGCEPIKNVLMLLVALCTMDGGG